MSSSSKGSKKPTIALSKVPSVKELCERLGFQRASLKETNSFTDATHAWRKSYQTASGLPGTELLLWNQLSVQLDLTRMAERFLEDGGNGERFWSPTRSWNDDSEVQYPEDRARIIELLKQLFWKQNRYAANNSTYGHKGVEGSRDASHDEPTPTRQTAIQTDDRASFKMPPKLATEDQHPPSPVAGPASSSSILPPASRTDAADDNTTNTTTNHEKTTSDQDLRPSVEDDIYEVPDDDDDGTRVGAKPLSSSSLPSPKPARTKRGAESRDAEPRKMKKPNVQESPKRRTARKTFVRSRPGFVAHEEVERILNDSAIQARLDHNLRLRQERAAQTFEHQPSVQQASTELEDSPALPNLPDLYSRQGSLLMQRFSAPMAPMLPFSRTEDTFHPSLESSRHMNHLELPSKAQAASPIDGREPPKPACSQDASPQPDSSSQERLQPPEPIDSPPTTDFSRIPSSTNKAERRSPADPPNQTVASNPTSKVAEVEQPLRSPLLGAPTKRSLTAALDTVSSTPTLSAQRVSSPKTSDVKIQGKVPDPPSAPKIHQAGRSTSAEITLSKPRAKTQVPLWIITREPRYTEERWDDGKFQGTPLATFVEELSKVTQRSHIEKMKLTLRTPTSDTKITVFKDAEDSWISAKETFVEKLKEARVEARLRRPNETPSFKILVEPFYEQGASLAGNVDEDDEEFDF